MDAGLTMTDAGPIFGAGVDVAYHYWPTSSDFRSKFNSLLRNETFHLIELGGTTGAHGDPAGAHMCLRLVAREHIRAAQLDEVKRFVAQQRVELRPEIARRRPVVIGDVHPGSEDRARVRHGQAGVHTQLPAGGLLGRERNRKLGSELEWFRGDLSTGGPVIWAVMTSTAGPAGPWSQHDADQRSGQASGQHADTRHWRTMMRTTPAKAPPPLRSLTSQ